MYIMVKTIKINACNVITNMWKIAHILPGIGIIYQGSMAINKKTNSPVNIFPNNLRARLKGLAISSTIVKIKLIGARAIPKG